MAKLRTAAAKKIHDKEDSSSEDEKLSTLKRTPRSKKSPAPSNAEPPRSSRGRPSRGKNNVTAEEENGKNGRNDKNAKNSKNSISNNESSGSGSEDEEPAVNRKRNAPSGGVTPKKSKPSTAASTSKDKGASKPPSKKKKKEEEEQYEVEEILDHKIEENVKYFLIRWKGYDSSADSWEKSRNISCPLLLAKYYEEHPEANVSTSRDKRKKGKKNKNAAPQVRPVKIDQQLDYDDSDWDENADYEVERIVDVHISRDNKREFLIHWKGYSSKSDTWEPEENLDCPKLIEKFMAKVEQMKNVSQKDLRPVRTQTQRFTLMTQASARRLSKRKIGQQRAVYYDCDE